MELSAYLEEAAGRPFSYDGNDCLLGFVGGWVQAVTGQDRAAPYRGRYRTELGCLRLVRREGGVEAIMRRALDGFPEVKKPEAGDVGCVLVPTDHGPVPIGGIYAGSRWAGLTAKGVLFAPFTALAIWRLHG